MNNSQSFMAQEQQHIVKHSIIWSEEMEKQQKIHFICCQLMDKSY